MNGFVRSVIQWVQSEFEGKVLAGIAVVVPLGATLLVLRSVVRFVEGFARPGLRHFFGAEVPGLGFLTTILVVYATGLFARNIVGGELVRWFERAVLGRVPVVRGIYQTLKKVVENISLPATKSFKRVVIVEFPREGVKSVGFMTGETVDPQTQKRLLNVFIPTVPNPTSGLLQLIPEEKVTPVDMTIEDGVRLVVSGGFLGSDRLGAA